MYQKHKRSHRRKRQDSSDAKSVQNESLPNQSTDSSNMQQHTPVSILITSTRSCHIECQIVPKAKDHNDHDLGKTDQVSDANERPSRYIKTSTMPSLCEPRTQSTSVTDGENAGIKDSHAGSESVYKNVHGHQQPEVHRASTGPALTKEQNSACRKTHLSKSVRGRSEFASSVKSLPNHFGSDQSQVGYHKRRHDQLGGEAKKIQYGDGSYGYYKKGLHTSSGPGNHAKKGRHGKMHYRGGVHSRCRSSHNQYSGTQQLPGHGISHLQHPFDRSKTESRKSAVSSSSTCTTELASTSVSHAAANAVLEIPGFYYDDVKKRYFKILPSHGNVNVVTKEGLAKQKAELQRQKDLQSMNSGQLAKAPIASKPGLSQKYDSPVMCLPNILTNGYQKGEYSQPLLEKMLTQMCAANLRQVGHTTVFKEPLGVYERIEHMLQLESSKEHDKLLCLWSIKDSMIQRLQLVSVKEVPRTRPGHMSVEFDPGHTTVLQSWNKITNVCWSDFPQYPGRKYILYTTMCHTSQAVSLAFIRNMDPAFRDEVHYFDFNLGHRATWTCAWNRHKQQFGVGTEKGCLVIDVNTRCLWQFKTLNSDAIAQVFSQDDGNLMYTGTRRGNILLHDLRSRSTFPQTLMCHKSSISCLRLSPDDAYLYASDFSGKIHKWDMRMREPVVGYDGLFNQYTKLPFHIDETESLLYGTGQDCYTKLWCLKTGRLLYTIPPPCPASRDTIPAVQYSSQWGGAKGNQGLIMGQNDTFYLYGCGIET